MCQLPLATCILANAQTTWALTVARNPLTNLIVHFYGIGRDKSTGYPARIVATIERGVISSASRTSTADRTWPYPMNDHGYKAPSRTNQADGLPSGEGNATMTPFGKSTGRTMGLSDWRPRLTRRSPCNTLSMASADGGLRLSTVRLQASANARTSCRRHSKQGRCPAVRAVASSRKNSSVYRPGAITVRPAVVERQDTGNPALGYPTAPNQLTAVVVQTTAAIAHPGPTG
jgi:hypothetical protein